MPTVSVKMSEKQFARLARVAKARSIPKSQVLIEAFERPQNVSRGPSAYDLVADLAGSVDGPKDSSTNPAYLDDFGADKKRRRAAR